MTQQDIKDLFHKLEVIERHIIDLKNDQYKIAQYMLKSDTESIQRMIDLHNTIEYYTNYQAEK